jgi:hypothetical protein
MGRRRLRVIASGRQTGRTTELIHECAAAEARGEISYMVCHSQQEAYRVAQQAKELGYENFPFPITYHEFLNGRYAGTTVHNFYIDNVEYLLERLVLRGPKIAAITITTDG